RHAFAATNCDVDFVQRVKCLAVGVGLGNLFQSYHAVRFSHLAFSSDFLIWLSFLRSETSNLKSQNPDLKLLRTNHLRDNCFSRSRVKNASSAFSGKSRLSVSIVIFVGLRWFSISVSQITSLPPTLRNVFTWKVRTSLPSESNKCISAGR